MLLRGKVKGEIGFHKEVLNTPLPYKEQKLHETEQQDLVSPVLWALLSFNIFLEMKSTHDLYFFFKRQHRLQFFASW